MDEKDVDVREILVLVRHVLMYNEQAATVAENEFYRKQTRFSINKLLGTYYKFDVSKSANIQTWVPLSFSFCGSKLETIQFYPFNIVTSKYIVTQMCSSKIVNKLCS